MFSCSFQPPKYILPSGDPKKMGKHSLANSSPAFPSPQPPPKPLVAKCARLVTSRSPFSWLLLIARVTLFLMITRSFLVYYVMRKVARPFDVRLITANPPAYESSDGVHWKMITTLTFHPDIHHYLSKFSDHTERGNLDVVYQFMLLKKPLDLMFDDRQTRIPFRECTPGELIAAERKVVAEFAFGELVFWNLPSCNTWLHVTFPIKYIGPWTLYNTTLLLTVVPGDSLMSHNMNLWTGFADWRLGLNPADFTHVTPERGVETGKMTWPHTLIQYFYMFAASLITVIDDALFYLRRVQCAMTGTECYLGKLPPVQRAHLVF